MADNMWKKAVGSKQKAGIGMTKKELRGQALVLKYWTDWQQTGWHQSGYDT